MIVLVTGILATLVGVLGLSNHFIGWLNILGIGLPPMAGIIIADYFVLNNRKYSYGKGTKYCSVNVYAFIAWILSAIIGYTIKGGVGSINSLLSAFVIYVIIMKTIGKNKKYLIGEVIE